MENYQLNNMLPYTKITPPRYLVWSTDTVDLANPFQRKRYIQQVLINGRAQDIATLDLNEVAQLLGEFNLPAEIRSLWEIFLELRHA